MNTRKIMIAALIVAIAALVAAFGFRNDNTPVNDSPSGQLVDANGQPVSLSDMKGKVLFVNNWASWCPPCIAEMPSIAKLKEKLKGVDVEFVMVSFDQDKRKAEAFMKKRKYDFDIYFPGQQYPFFTSSIPATFIIDKNGKTVAEHMGMADYSSDEIVNQLKTLADE